MYEVLNSLTRRYQCAFRPIWDGSLKARCVRGSLVLGIGGFLAKLVGFGSKVLLARVVVPEDMGLMVMILSLTALFEVLTEVGIKQSVIQDAKGDTPEYLNMAWWFQMVRAVGSYSLVFLITPLICRFYFNDAAEILGRYSMRELILLVRVAFLNLLFHGLISPRAYVLEKNLEFGKAVTIWQGGFVLGTAAIIVLALLLRDVWAIVIGTTSVSFFRCFFSYILCPSVPRVAFHLASFRALCRYACGMIGLPAMTYVAFNADILVAGKIAATAAVGYYGMARVLAMTPRDLFSRIVTPVLLPAFAKKQNDLAAICGVILRLARVIGIVCLPAIAFAITCSESILTSVYGSQQYGTAAAALSMLCLYVFLLIQGSVVGCMWFSIGQPGKHRAFVTVRAAIIIALIYPAIKILGIDGAAAVLLLASCVSFLVQILVAHRTVRLSHMGYFVSWLPGLVLATPVVLVVRISQVVVPEWQSCHLGTGLSTSILCTAFGLYLYKNTKGKADYSKR